MTDYRELIARVRDAEGTGPTRDDRLLPYRDCCGRELALCHCAKPGKATIGFGRNIEDIGISEPEAESLLIEDLRLAESALLRNYKWTITLDPVRYASLIELRLNMGGAAFAGFVLMLQAVRTGNWLEAGRQLSESRWWTEVGRRGPRIRQQLESGKW